jgi:hypothetical protein
LRRWWSASGRRRSTGSSSGPNWTRDIS